VVNGSKRFVLPCLTENHESWSYSGMNTDHPVKAFRERHGLTQTQLADKLGVRQTTVSMYETGERRMRLKTARRFIRLADDHGEQFSLDDLYPDERA
jgi:DNA-binding XRE family transcriptional regulator